VRIARELQEMTQNDLAAATHIPQAAISAIERGRIALGDVRAEKFARALKIHPAVLLWPQWDAEAEAKRAG
jgi:transcriptional regulator with XRE-family HTH domain